MRETMRGAPCLRLNLAIAMASLSATMACAAGEGEIFRSVMVGDCAKAGTDRACLAAPLLPGLSVTALDVLREIYPGLGADGSGHRFAGAEAVEAASDPDAAAAVDRAVDVASGDPVDIAVIAAGDRAYAAVVSGGVVAVVEIRPAYRPLGRLFVATDPEGTTSGYRLLMAAASSPVAITRSSHFNSQEGYDNFHMVGVVDDRLVDLYEGPYLNTMAEATEACELLDHREDISILGSRKSSQHGLSDIGMTVDYAATCGNGEASAVSQRKSFPITLTYDGSRYEGDTSELDDFNAQFAE